MCGYLVECVCVCSVCTCMNASVCVCVCVHAYMCMCVHKHTLCVHVHAYMCVCVCISIHCVCVCVCMCTGIHACVHACMSVYVHTCVYLHRTSDFVFSVKISLNDSVSSLFWGKHCVWSDVLVCIVWVADLSPFMLIALPIINLVLRLIKSIYLSLYKYSLCLKRIEPKNTGVYCWRKAIIIIITERRLQQTWAGVAFSRKLPLRWTLCRMFSLYQNNYHSSF